MVTTQQISPSQFLEKYARNGIYDPINVKVGTEQRIYARTTEGQVHNPDGYIVVYCVV